MDEKPRILGVDDSLTIRKALELVLQPAGYVLELAATGAEAVEKARGFQPAVILLDFILPDMRGTEVCRRLAADPATANIPVVLISAKGAEIRQAYQDVGNVVGYVAKPFTPEAIYDVVSEVVARSRTGSLAKIAAIGPEPGAGMEDMVDADGWLSGPEMPAPDGPQASPATGGTGEPQWGMGETSPESELVQSNGADGWDDSDEGLLEDEQVAAAETPGDDAPRRESLDLMFEALSAGLEGVYVEEVDTPAGAAADEAKSYTELVAQLTRQLGEALGQARSGTRYALCNDGSVRSLGDVLFDAYRRVCRLLFRAAAVGAVDHAAPNPARVLVAVHRDSELFDGLRAMTEQCGPEHSMLVSERFRQLPMVTRLYGPTHLVVEATGTGALWDQLRLVHAMPESRRLKVIGVTQRTGVRPDGSRQLDATALEQRGIQTVIEHGPDLQQALRQLLGAAEEPLQLGTLPSQTLESPAPPSQ